MVGNQEIRIAGDFSESAGSELRIHRFMDAAGEYRIAVDSRIPGEFLRLIQPLVSFQSGKICLRIVVVAGLDGGAAGHERGHHDHHRAGHFA